MNLDLQVEKYLMDNTGKSERTFITTSKDTKDTKYILVSCNNMICNIYGILDTIYNMCIPI